MIIELLPWIMLPVVGALIGFGTNWLAIKMLFHPRQPRYGIQGLLPRRQKDLAHKLGHVVAKELINLDSLLDHLDDVDLEELIGKMIDHAIEAKLEDLQKIPLIGKMITPDLLRGLRDSLVQEVIKHQDVIIAKIKEKAQDRIDIEAIVREKVERFELDKLESVVVTVAKNEFRAIEWWGAILGGFIGLVQAVIIYLLG